MTYTADGPLPSDAEGIPNPGPPVVQDRLPSRPAPSTSATSAPAVSQGAVANEAVRDTIPRIVHLPYLHAVLAGIRDGASFNRLRVIVWDSSRTVGRVAREGGDAQPLDDGTTHWSTTKDAIGECMKLGLVVRDPIPSKRALVAAHRERVYRLTPEGAAFVEAVDDDATRFREAIAPRLIAAHPYFAGLLTRLAIAPIAMPTFTEEVLRRFKGETSLWIDRLAEEVAAHHAATMGLSAGPEDIAALAAGVREGITRRFRRTERQPSSKDVLDTVEDAVAALTMRRVGLSIDAISLTVLMMWCRWLYIGDESRYVADVPGRVIWSTATIGAGPDYTITRRGLAASRDGVTASIPDAYRALAALWDAEGDEVPLVPIYALRATVAFRQRVAGPLVDRVLAGIYDAEFPAAFGVRFAVATGEWRAPSEPPFLLGGEPYFFVSVLTHPAR